MELFKTRTGLTLGSGAARGLTHIGVLKVVEESNIKIDYLTGCSIGALIGGGYAMGMSVKEIEDIALQTDWKRMAKIFSPTLSLSALLNDKYLIEFLDSIFGDTQFRDLHLPFAVVTANIETGQMVVIKEGSLKEAIRASVSIPMIFSPVTVGSYKLVDGGLVNPTPVDVNKQMGADKIIAVNLTQFKKCKSTESKESNQRVSNPQLVKDMPLNAKIEYFLKNPLKLYNYNKGISMNKVNNEMPGFGKILYHMFIIVQDQMANLTMQLTKPEILIEPDTSAYNVYDFHKAKELIDIGYRAGHASLKKHFDIENINSKTNRS
jgi:NTE family protein